VLKSVAPIALPFLLAACGGSDGPTSPGGGNNNPGGGTSASVKDDPSFSADIVPIFAQGCAGSGCHAPPGEAGLVLSTSPYGALVNVPSTQTRELRVIPGNANDSYLVKKLEGRASVGNRMPAGGQLNSTDLANIKNWINRGAKNN
jgi:hypothetical protein